MGASGDTVTIYRAGLAPWILGGGRSYYAGVGQSVVQNSVSASSGGQIVDQPTAVLVSGLVAVYQVVVTIPRGVPPGDNVPAAIRSCWQSSPAAETSVR